MTLASIIFENIKGYQFLHSGQILIKAINESLRVELPKIADFLEARFKVAKFKSEHQKQLRPEVIIKEAGEEYGAIHIDSCMPIKEIKQKMFKEDGAMVPMKLHFYDIPLIFRNCKEGYDFIFALHEQTDVDIYAKKSIQRIITYHWQCWKKYFAYFIVMPQITVLLLFLYLSHWSRYVP